MCGNLAASQPGGSLLLLVADCNAGAENSDPATQNPSPLFSGAELNKGSIAVQIDTP
jgi:hypothetical protein